MTDRSPAQSWLDDFFASYHAHRPVNATFIGVHNHDHRLPDLSENGLGDRQADMEDLLRRAGGLEGEGHTAGDASAAGASPRADSHLLTFEDVDLLLARGFLEIELAELASAHFQQGNPSLYTGEAVFGVMSLFLSDFAPLAERTEAAVERLEGVPALLAQGRANVRRAPPTWTERARRECTGALAFLEDGIDLLGAQVPPLEPRLRAAADRAAHAFSHHAAWLDTDLAASITDDVACGEEMLSLYLRKGHFVDRDPAEIVAYAHHEMEKALARLREGAAAFGADTPTQALAGLREIHPTPDGYQARYREIWDEVRALAEEKELLTWPDFPLRYVPRPEWARKAAPYLYFLFYRSPAAFHRPPVHDYLVAPLDPDAPDDATRHFLELHNDSVIRLNHVVHHGGIGHHVQNWHAFRSPSRVGQIAAVDCASRIAMFSGGTMAEGWACYATDLVQEAGGLTPLEAYAELHSRVRMCARAVVDCELHTGRMTLTDAARLYGEVAGMGLGPGLGEAVKNSMFPGGALMYLVGSDGIHALRSFVRAREGAAFTLRGFHDRLLACGSIPVTLAARLLTRQKDGTRDG